MTRKNNVQFDICTVGLLIMILLQSITDTAYAGFNESLYNSDNSTETIDDNSNGISGGSSSSGSSNTLTLDIIQNLITTTSPTTTINELIAPVSDIMQSSEIISNNQKENLFAYNYSSNNNNNNNNNGSSSNTSHINNNNGKSPTETIIITTTTSTTTTSLSTIITTTATTIITSNKLSTTSPFPELKHKITHPRPYHSKHHHEHHLGPFFEEPLNASSGALMVGVHLATDAVLNCRVGMLKDKTVMWVRRTLDKFSLLTVGNVTYSGDPRIKITFQYPNNWRLHINGMQKEDAGIYMCQVSTHPPRVFATNVTVLPPAIRVVDEQGHEVHDRFYKIGSAINLTCQVATSYLINNSYSMTNDPVNSLLHYPGISLKQNVIDIPPAKSKISDEENFYKKIIWRKDGEELTKDVKINISSTTGWLNSRLSILSAERLHSGVFSCSILNTTFAIVNVQILNGETPAAVQHSLAQSKKLNNLLNKFLLFQIIPILYISC